MGEEVVTQGILLLKPYKVDEIRTFEMVQEINEHISMKLTATISSEEKEKALLNTHENQMVRVEKKPSKIIFVGIVKKIEIYHEGDVYWLKLEAVSNTILMDMKKREASYQNKNQKYSTIINQIKERQSTSTDISCTIDKGKKIEQFTLQYQETDWEFLKRMASRMNTGLVPYLPACNEKNRTIRFYFGLPKGANHKLDKVDYRMTKNIQKLRICQQNLDSSLNEEDVISYEVETEESFSFGDIIEFGPQKLYIKKIYSRLKNAVLLHTYFLTTEKGCDQKKIYNEAIIGLAIQGTVLEVKQDKVKVEFFFDRENNTTTPKNLSWEFPYATMYTSQGNSGFYCMPEEGDVVLIYFPTKDEKEGVGIHSLRVEKDKQDTSGDNSSDTSKATKKLKSEEKYLRTRDGKELKLTPKEIVLSALDDEIFICLNEDNGITIKSVNKPIQIVTEKDLSFEANERIFLKGKKEIKMSCKSSTIILDDKMTMKGKKVKKN